MFSLPTPKIRRLVSRTTKFQRYVLTNKIRYLWERCQSFQLLQIKKVQIEVYYEVWCPDSRRFILDQLLPTWRKLKNEIDVHWKPYGKASVRLYFKKVLDDFSNYFFCSQSIRKMTKVTLVLTSIVSMVLLSA